MDIQRTRFGYGLKIGRYATVGKLFLWYTGACDDAVTVGYQHRQLACFIQCIGILRCKSCKFADGRIFFENNFTFAVCIYLKRITVAYSRVRRISLGITTRPRSSILLTIPVAFIIFSPLCEH